MYIQQPEQKLDYSRYELERSTAVRKHYQSGSVAVVIPAMQGIVTGLLVAGLISVIWLALKLSYTFYWVSGAFFLVSLVVWWMRVADWSNLIWQLETALNVDFTGDKQVGKPVERLKVDITKSPGHTNMIELWGSRRYILQFLKALYEGNPVSEREWTGKDKPFSEKEFMHNRDELFEWGYCEWVSKKDNRKGFRGTDEGKEWMFEALKQGLPSPTTED